MPTSRRRTARAGSRARRETVDTYSLERPARTRTKRRLVNEDCSVTQAGPALVARRDPQAPDTSHADLQHGVIVRYDKRDGQRIGSQPQEEKGAKPLRWNR